MATRKPRPKGRPNTPANRRKDAQRLIKNFGGIGGLRRALGQPPTTKKRRPTGGAPVYNPKPTGGAPVYTARTPSVKLRGKTIAVNPFPKPPKKKPKLRMRGKPPKRK
jgi:hypothetical protein